MKYLLFVIASLMSIGASAQFSVGARTGSFDASHVNWSFTVSRLEEKVCIEAVAHLESGWHIFSTEPGGDGSLIPTLIEVKEIAGLKAPVETKEAGNLVKKDMEGIGMVNYYENKAGFKLIFAAPADLKTFTGQIAYQICNEKMCMAPTTKSFSVNLK